MEKSGEWTFEAPHNNARTPSFDHIARPRIVIDGYFFQHSFRSGISRVWRNLLREWSSNGFGNQIIFLDRGGSAPRFENVHYFPIEFMTTRHSAQDAIRLEQICRRVSADLFVSTYYTTPLTTASVFIGHDMIPEVLGLNFEEPMWREKQRAINHASAHIMVSANSARDLERFMPAVHATALSLRIAASIRR